MKLYRYITGIDDSKFCMKITKLLNKGWKLYGNPTLTFNGNSCIVGQTIIKKIKNKKLNKNTNLDDY
jgi:hypothetical protein